MKRGLVSVGGAIINVGHLMKTSSTKAEEPLFFESSDVSRYLSSKNALLRQAVPAATRVVQKVLITGE